MKISEGSKGVVALSVLAWVFATMGIFARFLNTEFALFEQTYLRIGIAFLIGVVVFSRELHWKKLQTLPVKDWLVLIFRSVTLYLGVTLFTEAILTTKYANASFVTVLPLLPVFGYFFLGQKLRFPTILAIGLGFIGTLLILLKDLSGFSIGYGEFMAFLSMLAFDFSYIGRKWHSEHLNNKETTVVMFAIGSVFLFATSLILVEPLPSLPDFTTLIIGALIASAIFNLANLYLTNYGFGRVKAGVAGNILTLETVFALAYSVLLFNEIPVLRDLLGAALILTSVYLVNRFETE